MPRGIHVPIQPGVEHIAKLSSTDTARAEFGWQAEFRLPA